MQTHCSFKSAIEKIDEKIDRGSRKKSHGPYRPFLEGAAWPTDAEGSHVLDDLWSRTRTKREQTEVLLLSPPEKKNSRYFWVPPRTSNTTEYRLMQRVSTCKKSSLGSNTCYKKYKEYITAFS